MSVCHRKHPSFWQMAVAPGNVAMQIILFAENSVVFPGQELRGVIGVNVVGPTIFSSVCQIRLSGAEKINVSSETSREIETCESVFLVLESSIQTGGQIQAGYHEFPLVVKLPTKIAPTLTVTRKGQSKLEIEYNIRATIPKLGLSVKEFYGQCDCLFTVNAIGSSVAEQQPTEIRPVKQPILAYFCIPRGFIWMSARSEQATIELNESFEVGFAVENFSSSAILQFAIEVHEISSWMMRGERKYATSVVASKVYAASELASLDVHGHAQNSGTVAPSDAEIEQRIQSDVLSNRHSCNLQLNADANISYNGKIFRIEHKLMLVCRTSFGSSNIAASCPIAIVAPSAMPVPVDEPEVVVINAPYIIPGDGSTPYQLIASSVGHAALPNLVGNQVKMLNDWLAENSANDLTPQDFARIFKMIISALEQVHAAEVLASYVNFLTCEHIAESVRASIESARPDIVHKFASKCVDPENHQLVKAALSAFQWILVEKHFKGKKKPLDIVTAAYHTTTEIPVVHDST